jgi:two-component system cell cycle response regulator
VRLASNVRAIDLPCRYGGEEFVVIMPDTKLEDARRIAERIRVHVAGSPFRVGGDGEPLSVTISVGVASTVGAGDSAEALLKRADEAVYAAKAAGRNAVIVKTG